MNAIPIGAPITIRSALATLCGQQRHYTDPGQLGADLWEHYYSEARTEEVRGSWIATDHRSITLVVELADQTVEWDHEGHNQWNWSTLGNPPLVLPENPYYFSNLPAERALLNLQGTDQHPHAPLARLFTAIDRNAVTVAGLIKIDGMGGAHGYDDYAVLRLHRADGCLAQGEVGYHRSTARGDCYRVLYNMEVGDDPWGEGRGDHVGSHIGWENT